MRYYEIRKTSSHPVIPFNHVLNFISVSGMAMSKFEFDTSGYGWCSVGQQRVSLEKFHPNDVIMTSTRI